MADPRVRIVVVADDQSKAALDRVVQNLDQIPPAAGRASAGFDNLARGAQRATQVIERGYGIMTRLDLTQISLQQSTERVRVAQEKFNEAVAKGGPASEGAVQASRELEAAQAALEKTQLRARLSYVLIAGDLVGMAAQVPRAVAALTALRSAQTAATVSSVGLQAALNPLAGAAVAVGVVAAMVAIGDALGSVDRNADVAGKSLEDLQVQFDALAGKRERVAKDLAREELVGGTTSAETALRKRLEMLDTQLGQIRQAMWAVGEAQNQVEFDKLAAEAEDAARKLEDASRTMASGVRQALGAAGIDLSKFTQEFQDQMLRAAGVSESVVQSLRPVVDVEDLLAASSGEAREALVAQLDVTNRKGESTEDLARRLGLTVEEEQRLRAEGRWTTDGIISQAEATERLARANGASQGASGPRADSSLLPSWAPGAGGSWVPVAGAAQDMSSHDNSYTRSIQQVRSDGTRDRAMAMMDAIDAQAKADPRILGTAAYRTAYGMAAHTARSGTAGNIFGFGHRGWQMALESIGVRFAANGFDGRVTRPTMFVAGEAGPEHVSVTPGGRPGGGLVVQGGIHVDARGMTQAQATRAVVDGLTIVQKRAASRRGY